MDLSRGQKLMVIVGLLALLAGIVALSVGRLGARPAAVVYEAPAVLAGPTVPQLRVHVAGAVRRPGVYALPPGSIVNDAIAMAGGMLPEADPDALNLAERLKDERQVLVPTHDAAPPAETPTPAPAAAPASPPVIQAGSVVQSPPTIPPAVPARVSLNQATKEQLETVPGIGPQRAANILYYRHEHGGFRSLEELLEVDDIGPGTLAVLRQYLTL
jgi:competence protein ComEA